MFWDWAKSVAILPFWMVPRAMVAATVNMVSEKTFYEDAKDRDARFEALIHAVTAEDPDWIARFVPFLRDTMNMRSASVVMAADRTSLMASSTRRMRSVILVTPGRSTRRVRGWHRTAYKR